MLTFRRRHYPIFTPFEKNRKNLSASSIRQRLESTSSRPKTPDKNCYYVFPFSDCLGKNCSPCLLNLWNSAQYRFESVRYKLHLQASSFDLLNRIFFPRERDSVNFPSKHFSPTFHSTQNWDRESNHRRTASKYIREQYRNFNRSIYWHKSIFWTIITA